MMESSIAAVLTQLATRLPSFLVYLTGLVLAIVYWRRYPRPCLWLVLAMGLAVCATLASTVTYAYLPQALANLGWEPGRFHLVLGVVNVVFSIAYAGATALLLTAVFAGRQPARPAPPRRAPDEDHPVTAAGGPDTRIQG